MSSGYHRNFYTACLYYFFLIRQGFIVNRFIHKYIKKRRRFFRMIKAENLHTFFFSPCFPLFVINKFFGLYRHLWPITESFYNRNELRKIFCFKPDNEIQVSSQR